jgi:uncharacterized protein with NRDE domain
MCIVALAWQSIDEFPLLLLSNRDEFYHRPTKQLHYWQDDQLYAGQDLEQGGTWMGVTPSGRWAVVTNFREKNDQKFSTSRGDLIRDFLTSNLAPLRFAQELEKNQNDYAGFNLILGDQRQTVYMSNRGEAPQVLARGVYVVSNGLMSEHWEKTAHLRKRFTQEFLPLLQQPDLKNDFDIEQQTLPVAWDVLEDQRKIETDKLPNTGISLEMEELLSSSFIQSPVYGTRCSNFLLMQAEQNQNQFQWWEKTQYGEKLGEVVKVDVDLS